MKKNYFSLIELLSVTSVIFIIVTLLSPSLNKALEQARTISCQSNLKPIFLYEDTYASDHNYLLYVKSKNAPELKDRLYWSHPNSRMGDYISYENLGCPSDPHIENENTTRYHRDGISYGRNSHLNSYQTNFSNISHPTDKVFYTDAGHRFSNPIERSRATRNNLSSALHVHAKSDWDNEGVFNRHQERNANVLFLDGHVEIAFDVIINSRESLNYKSDNEIYDRHWNLAN